MAKTENEVRLRLGYDVSPIKLGLDLRLKGFRMPHLTLMPESLRTLIARIHGGADATHGHPTDAAPSRSEREIKNWFRRRRDNIVIWLSVLCAAAAGHVQRAKPTAQPDEEWTNQEIDRCLVSVHHAYEPDFRRNDETVRKARVDLESYMRERGLDRPPKQPNRAVSTLLLVIVFLLETLTSTMLFVQSAEGVLIAFLYAASFSAINVGIGLLMGHFGVSYALHLDDWRRGMGIAVLVLFGTFALVFNVYLGHLRDAFSAAGGSVNNADQLARQAMEQMGRGWFAFNSGFAVLVMLIGPGVVLLAMWRGYSGFTDPVPGVGSRYATVNEAEREQERTLNRALSTLNRVSDALRWQLDRASSWHQWVLRFFNWVTGFVIQASQWVPDKCEQIRGRAARRLDAYRGANEYRRMRRQIPGDPPQRFNEIWTEPFTFDKEQSVYDKIDAITEEVEQNIQIIARCGHHLSDKTKEIANMMRSANAQTLSPGAGATP